MALFKNDHLNIGTIKPNSRHTIKWEFDEMKRLDIATYKDDQGIMQYAIYKPCSCQGDAKVSDSGITLEYSDQGHKGKKEKYITIYLTNNKIPVRVKNEKGVEEFNPDLGYINLKFDMVVDD